MEVKIFTKSDKETKKLGETLALEILKSFDGAQDKLKTATVLSLEGDLGAGKTTFTQGFGKFLGVKEQIQSPTFVILKIYPVTPPNPPLVKGRSFSLIPSFIRRGKGRYSNLVHVDAYRLKSKDFKIFGWKNFIKNKDNIILVEWGNKIKNILPKNSLRIIFKHIGHSNERLIKIII